METKVHEAFGVVDPDDVVQSMHSRLGISWKNALPGVAGKLWSASGH